MHYFANHKRSLLCIKVIWAIYSCTHFKRYISLVYIVFSHIILNAFTALWLAEHSLFALIVNKLLLICVTRLSNGNATSSMKNNFIYVVSIYMSLCICIMVLLLFINAQKKMMGTRKRRRWKTYMFFVRYQNRLTSLWVPFHCYLNYPICEKRTRWR